LTWSSDNDLCSDVCEAGFTDPDGDKILGELFLRVILMEWFHLRHWLYNTESNLFAALLYYTNFSSNLRITNAIITLIDNGVILSMAIIYQWYNLEDKLM
jgi:hypothetical protein